MNMENGNNAPDYEDNLFFEPKTELQDESCKCFTCQNSNNLDRLYG